MKRIWSAALMLVALPLAAQAADMPVKAPYYKAPPVAVFDWSGFYIGLHAGYGAGNKDWTDVTTGVPTNSASFDVDGVFGGGQAGFNYQVGNLVLGVEGEIAAAGINGSTSSGALVCTAGAPCASDINWLATLAARLGYAWGPTLLYVKGGGAWAGEDHTYANINETSETRGGWLVGVGLEYAFAGPWSAKLEYNYIDFGSKTVAFTPAGASFDIDQDLHLLKIGLNYRFGYAAPVVARY